MQLVSVEKKVTGTEQQLFGGSDSGLLTHGLADRQMLHDAACPAARSHRYCAGAGQGASLGQLLARDIGRFRNKPISLLTFHKEYGQCRCDKSQRGTKKKQEMSGK